MDAAEFEEALKRAEVKLARLRSLYEQWFQGIERIEPQVARKDFDRSIEILKREQPRNTALRFRLQQLVASYGTYGLYWGRIAKQIEDGTYRRDLQRMRARQQRRAERPAEVEVELDGFDELDAFGDDDLAAILGALQDTPSGPPTDRPEVATVRPDPSSPGATVSQSATTPLPPRPEMDGAHASSVRPAPRESSPDVSTANLASRTLVPPQRSEPLKPPDAPSRVSRPLIVQRASIMPPPPARPQRHHRRWSPRRRPSCPRPRRPRCLAQVRLSCRSRRLHARRPCRRTRCARSISATWTPARRTTSASTTCGSRRSSRASKR